MIVVDTDVVAYALLSADHREVTDAVRHKDRRWIAPPLWASEFRNVIATYVRTGGTPRGGALEIWLVEA